MERIQKIIANRGMMSRRKAESLIFEGKVTVNGIRAGLGDKADALTDKILVDGKPLKNRIKYAYYLLNKPKEVMVTTDDPGERATIFDLPAVKSLREQVIPVGRIDLMTEGLLLLSNDGDFIYKASHPSFNIEKIYYLRIDPDFTQRDIEKLAGGIVVDGRRTPKSAVKKLRPHEIVITIHEGRNRIVRKMMDALGYKVYCLRRIRVGKINLGLLGVGDVRRLTAEEVAYVKNRTQSHPMQVQKRLGRDEKADSAAESSDDEKPSPPREGFSPRKGSHIREDHSRNASRRQS